MGMNTEKKEKTMSNIIRELEKEQLRTDLPRIRVGDTVKLFVKVVRQQKRLQTLRDHY